MKLRNIIFITSTTVAFCLILLFSFSCVSKVKPIKSKQVFQNEEIKRYFTDEQAVERLAHVNSHIAYLDEFYKKNKDEIDKVACVEMTVDHELLICGETVTVTLKVQADKVPNTELVVSKDWLASSSEKSTYQLDWKKQDKQYIAQWSMKANRTGNFLVYWKSDIGGDVPEFWRNFSVIDNSWNVQIIHNNANGNHDPTEYLHKYHLPSTLFCGYPLHAKYNGAGHFLSASLSNRQFGDDWVVSLWLSNTYADMLKKEEVKLYEEHKAVQEAVFAGYMKLMRYARFWRGADMAMCSGMSNEVVDSMHKAGITIFDGLYPDQNWADGGDYRINHWGMLQRPSFVGSEDFRKCDRVGDVPTVAIAQCHRQTILCRDYNCVFSLEAGADYMIDRYSQYHRPRKITDVIGSKEYDMLRSIWDAKYKRMNPLFFTCCLEFAGFDWMPEMHQLQPLFIDYVVKEVAKGRLAVTTPHAVADFYRRHFKTNPESIVYFPDMWAGRVVTGYDRFKPPIYPDTLEFENDIFRAIMRKGETLPYVYYDQNKKWESYIYWGGDESPRDRGGYVIPNTDDRFKVKPPILDTRGMKVKTERAETDKGTLVKITVDSKISQNDLTLAVWDIAREYSEDDSMFEVKNAKRFVAVAAPFTGNLNGVIVADIKKGENKIEVLIKTPERKIKAMDVKLSDSIYAKVFERDGGAMAYVYNPTDKTASVHLTFDANKEVTFYNHATVSDEPVKLSSGSEITIEPKKPIRITGLTAEELKACVEGAQYYNVTVKTPYCQINDCGL